MANNQRILQHPGLNPLWESMERERRQQQFAALALMLSGLVMVVITLLAQSNIWPLVGGALAAGGLWWLYHLLTEQPIAHWRRRLRDEPESIVWVYGVVTERMPFGVKFSTLATLYLVDAAGNRHDFAVKADQLKLVTKTLNRVLPRAEFGYSEERELQYIGEVTNFRGRPERDPFRLSK